MKMAKLMAVGTLVVNVISFVAVLLITIFYKETFDALAGIMKYPKALVPKFILPADAILLSLVLIIFSIALLGATLFTEKLNRSLRVVAAIGIFCFTFFSKVLFTPIITTLTAAIITKTGATSTIAYYSIFRNNLNFIFNPINVLGIMMIASVCGMLLFFKGNDLEITE